MFRLLHIESVSRGAVVHSPKVLAKSPIGFIAVLVLLGSKDAVACKLGPHVRRYRYNDSRLDERSHFLVGDGFLERR
jgi:hypothetical protein